MTRIVALADSDSYVKWAAALLGRLGPGWDASMLVVDSPLAVSDGQLRAALAGSGLGEIDRVVPADAARRAAAGDPDVVLVATVGPIARVLLGAIARTAPTAALVTGLPGISVPATRKALRFRRRADLVVLHSRREIREFTALAESMGMPQRFGLATLPFLADRPGGGGDLVFAAQAIVPRTREDRLRVAAALRRAALADPTRRVVVKVRALPGEAQTHAEVDPYPELLAELGDLPPNLVVSAAPMDEALDAAEGLVTVSSTALIEAVARGIPGLALDTFGISDRLINPVFVGSGLFGGEDALVAREFRHPAPSWRVDNYFHDPAESTWDRLAADLAARRRAGELPGRVVRTGVGGALRVAWDRKQAFGSTDRSLAGGIALAVGVPARAAARAARAVRRRRRLGRGVAGASPVSASVAPRDAGVPTP